MKRNAGLGRKCLLCNSGAGIDVDLQGGKYRPSRVSQTNPSFYWDNVYQWPLRHETCQFLPELEETYPFPQVVVHGVNPPDKANFLSRNLITGEEILGKTRPVRFWGGLKRETDRLQKLLEYLHGLADHPKIPAERRDFFRNFRLPDPATMPECWRVSGFFNRRLYVLWGLELADARDSGTFLPQSTVSSHWNDAKDRSPIPVHMGLFGSRPLVKRVPCTNDTSVPTAGDGKQAGFPEDAPTGCLPGLFKMLGLILICLVVLWLTRGGIPGCSFHSHRTDASTGTSSEVTSSPKDTDRVDHSNETDGVPQHDISPRVDQPPTRVRLDNPERPLDGAETNAVPTRKHHPPRVPQTTPPPAVPKRCPSCGEKVNDAGRCPNLCPRCMRHLDANRKCPVCDRETVEDMFRFQVKPPEVLSETGGIACVRFTLEPVDDLSGRQWKVVDWTVNAVDRHVGNRRDFTPEGGLSYSKSYTIGASVQVDGKAQRVLPYQWNNVDAPAWQIVKDGADGSFYKFRLICSNSSSVQFAAENWKARYRRGQNYLDEFHPQIKKIDDKSVMVSCATEGFNTYFLELSADIRGKLRNSTISTNRTDLFEFMHGDSAQTLVRMKYEGALNKIFYCLARTQAGDVLNGTAFAVSDKYLLTNFHVAVGSIEEQYVDGSEGPYKVSGCLMLSNEKRKQFYAKVIASDRERDLALIRICSASGEEVDERFDNYFELADSSLLHSINAQNSRNVLAIGYPRGTVRNGPPAFTDGKAERIEQVQIGPGSVENVGHYTNIEPGYSGGPLIDMETGKILGVNRGGLLPVSDNQKPLKMATSANEIRRAFKELQNSRR